MLRRLMLWLRIVPPPEQYFRCGWAYLQCSAEGQKRLAEQWDEEDERYAAWVEAHPRPKMEWVEQARRIRGEKGPLGDDRF